MENESFGEMFSNIFKNGFKSRSTLTYAIIVPLVILIIIGYIVTMEGVTEPVTIGIVNNDNGIANMNMATSIINELKNQENVSNVVYIDLNEVNSSLKNRSIDGAVIFPENFTMDLAQSDAKLSVVLEGTDSSKSMLIDQAVSSSVTKVAAEVSNTTSPLTLDVTTLYGTGLDFANLFMYRFMALFTFVFSLVIAMQTLNRDKSTGILQKRAASPIKSTFAYTLGLCIFGFIVALIIYAFVIYIMGISVVGGGLDAILVMFLLSLVGTAVGVLFGSATRNGTQSYLLMLILLILQIVFSGLFIEISKFDAYTQLLSYSLPVTYGLDALQSIVIRGFSLTDVGTDITALFISLVVVLIISILGFRFAKKSASSNS